MNNLRHDALHQPLTSDLTRFAAHRALFRRAGGQFDRERIARQSHHGMSSGAVIAKNPSCAVAGSTPGANPTQ
jgi:hypothetical protein